MPDPLNSSSHPPERDITRGPSTAMSPITGPNAASTDAASPSTDENGAERDGPRTRSAKSGDPENLESFVALAYSRKGQRIGMKKKVAISIAQGSPPEDAVWHRIQELAKSDVLLAVPKQMLLAAIPNKGTTRAWLQVLEACLAALRANPASSELVPLLLTADGGSDKVDEILEQAAGFRFATITRPGSTKLLSKSQVAMLRANVTGIAALWMVAVRGAASHVVLRSLHEWVWSAETRRTNAVTDTWRRLLEVRDPTALGLACEAFVSAAEHARRDADSARASEAAALQRIGDLEATSAQLKAQLDHEKLANEDLRKAELQAALDADAALSHAKDDYERLRTRVLRRLTREVELLDEGMLAIKREPPKLHVMTDHGDRALTGLREEIKSLQKEAGL